MKRGCAECGHKLVGRTDKKFCNDYCRNAFNNKRYRKEHHVKRQIQGVLNLNYGILKGICEQEAVTESSVQDLRSKGYQMQFFTNLSLTGEGEVLRQCFDMGLLTKENGQLYVINMKKKPNLRTYQT
ncbi:MAG: hypothetical protein ACPGR7_06355 [Flavobacteriaceae bacterium]|nr:hypothetical protein [Flavobacteriaceae bacterium]